MADGFASADMEYDSFLFEEADRASQSRQNVSELEPLFSDSSRFTPGFLSQGAGSGGTSGVRSAGESINLVESIENGPLRFGINSLDVSRLDGDGVPSSTLRAPTSPGQARGALRGTKRTRSAERASALPDEKNVETARKALRVESQPDAKRGGKPGQPRPPTCAGKTRTSLMLLWRSPKDIGQSTIDYYQVQKRAFESGKKSVVPPWENLFSKQGRKETQFEVKGLQPGSLTQFRVKAHNQLGWGKYSRASNPFPTELADPSAEKAFVEGTVDPSIIQWDTPRIRLGKGAFGVVFRSAIGGYRGTTVAVKIGISADSLSFDEKTAQKGEILESWSREVKILSSLRHPNLVLFMGACRQNGRTFILTEYMAGGSLENAIYRPDSRIQNREWVQSIVGQVASAMSFLHSNRPHITHRDLKPANVLLDKTWTHAKVCDFGFARMHNKEVMSTLTKFAGTTPYMAPEALEEKDNVSSKVDVYSFGVLTAETLLGRRPFEKSSNTQVLKAVCLRGERPYDLRSQGLGPVAALIEECWALIPESRPTFSDIISRLKMIGWKMV